jgi:hypothetical protein
MTLLTKKLVGTAVLVGLFFGTSFIGTSVASAYFSLQGKNIQFHAIVESISGNTWTLLTSSTDPITVTVNNKTKFPFGKPGVGDVIFVVGKIQKDTDILALTIKMSSWGGPNDIYGTDGDDVSVKKASFIESQCPWLRVVTNASWGTTIVFKVDQNTKFVGSKGCADLKPGDKLSITGVDTNENGFVAKMVIKHGKKHVKLPEDEQEDS